MANTLYDLTREKLGRGLLDLLTYTGAPPTYTTGLRVALVGAGYVFSQAHDFYDDLGANVIADSDPLTSAAATAPATFLLGILDADDITLTGVPATPIASLVIYQDNAGATSTWPLIAYIDVAGGTLPVTPSGTVTIQWSASGILKI